MSITQEMIDIACYQSRMKYETLNDYIIGGNISDISSFNNKYIIVFDVSYVLSVLKRISSVDTDTDCDNETIIRIVYGLLNSVGHYRHFFTTKMHCSSVIIMYSSDKTYYDDFSKTMNLLRKILNLFKKTIFIEKLDEGSKFIYQHVCYFTCMNISITNSAAKRNCKIVYIGNNDLSLQMLRIDRDMINIKHNHIEHGLNLLSRYICGDKFDKDINHNTDLIGVILSIFGFKHGFPKLESIKSRRNLIIYKKLIENCNTRDSIDKDDCNYLLDNIPLNDKDKELVTLRLKTLDVDFQNNTFSLSKSLLAIWSNKLHSKSTNSINDFVRIDGVDLNFSWLEGR